MRRYKLVENEYILQIGTGSGGEEIKEQEYNAIYAAIGDKPTAADGYDYRLKADLTWEQYEVEPIPEPEPDESDKAAAYDILVGEAE